MAATEFTIENEVASAESESTRNKETEDSATEDVAMVEETNRDRKAITFFCHNNDKGWVEETAEKLGQFVCQHGDADFIGGVSIPDNILRLIRECDTIVLVLSPDFLNSQLCKYEAQLTLSEHLFREQKIVIPVLLRGEDIPDFISPWTHLDVDDIEFWEKFMGALTRGDLDEADSCISLQRFYVRREQDQFNGKMVLKVESRGHCCGERYDYDSIFDKFNIKGIQIDNESRGKVKRAMEEVGFNSCICCIKCYTSIYTMEILLMLFFLVLVCVLYFWYTGANLAGEVQNTHFTTFVFIITFIGVILLLLYLMVFFGLYELLSVYLTTAMRASNSVLIDHDVLFGLGTTNYFTGRRELAFFHFRTKSCQAYIENYLREHLKSGQRRKTIWRCFDSNVEEGSDEMEPLTSEDTTIEKLAKRYLSEVAGIYVYQQLRRRLINPSTGQRHSPQGPCLCQLVDELFFNKPHTDRSPDISLFKRQVYSDIFRLTFNDSSWGLFSYQSFSAMM
ncbi:uncharacterized protein [Ptychodera flava]|uniref:uncharacterized protein isoform X2 n=1 Tax=Ptychodera flava TaxID=63121 RepID=UPI00396A89BE